MCYFRCTTDENGGEYGRDDWKGGKMYRWRISRFSEDNRLLGEEYIWARNVTEICKLLGKPLNETELAIIRVGNGWGYCFQLTYSEALPENRIQNVFIKRV